MELGRQARETGSRLVLQTCGMINGAKPPSVGPNTTAGPKELSARMTREQCYDYRAEVKDGLE